MLRRSVLVCPTCIPLFKKHKFCPECIRSWYGDIVCPAAGTEIEDAANMAHNSYSDACGDAHAAIQKLVSAREKSSSIEVSLKTMRTSLASGELDYDDCAF